MPKLKLKQKNEIGVGIKSIRHKDVASFKNDREQSKLLRFFRTSQEDDRVDYKEPKKVQANEETTSRFFQDATSHKAEEMDESVSEFKPELPKRVQNIPNDTKMSSKGKKPAKLKNSSKNATQSYKSKRTKGKQNLQEYTKEFDQVCAIGGIDIDPEHLQLAIALSRSLTDFQGSSLMNEKAQSQNIREPSTSLEYETEEDKVKKIRKTLDQYGFKIPVGPILLRPKMTVKRKRLDKKMMNSPLLTKSLEEKKQITSNIVSQILFESQAKTSDFSDSCNPTEIESIVLSEIWAEKSPIFSKARFQYADMKEFDVFYVKNLITPSDSKAGCLLKDWKKIPGRDPSPERTSETLDFRETAMFTNHFNDLLSSTISYIRDKMPQINVASPAKSASSPSPRKTETRDSGICTAIVNNSTSSNKSLEICKDNVAVINNDSRSCSPDIFEDFYAEDEINDHCDSDTNDRSKPASVEIVDSSDDELPNVYMSQPRKKEVIISPPKYTSPPDEICINVNHTENIIEDKIDNSIDLTQESCLFENCQSYKLNAEEINVIHSDSGKSDEDETYLENTTIINDSKICEDVNTDNVINDSIDLTQNYYFPVKSKISDSFEFDKKDTNNKYFKFNSLDSKIKSNSTMIDITDNLTTSKDVEVDLIVLENKKLLETSPYKKKPQINRIIDEDIETSETIMESHDRNNEDIETIEAINEPYGRNNEDIETIEVINEPHDGSNKDIKTIEAINEPHDKNNDSALQFSQNESFANSTLKIHKHNKISFGSLNDSIKFDQLLKDFRSNQLNQNGDCYNNEDKESTIEDSVDLTEEDNVCSEEPNSRYLSRTRNFSQIYESDNGIVHFESYCEENEPLDVSGASESSHKETNDLIKNKRNNVNDISMSSPECIKNKSKSSNRVSTDSIFENSINYDVPVSLDNNDIDLTQSSNDSSYSSPLTQDKSKIVNNFHHNKSDDAVNVSCGEKKILRESFSDNSAINDVFVISDEEFNYSIGTSHTKKHWSNTESENSRKINCNEISESDCESSIIKVTSLDASNLLKFRNENDKSELDLNTIEQECNPYHRYRISNKFDLYGSSIFDQIPSCNSSLAKDECFNNVNKSKLKSLKNTDIESLSARYYPQSNDLTQPETVLNCSEDLPNVYMKNRQEGINEIVQKVIGEDLIPKTMLVKAADSKETPEAYKYTIKTDNVTPAQNYSAMDTPRIHKELSKFGLKPLKRKRAVQMLEHIYSQTHPIVSTNDLEKKLKRRKIQYNSTISESASISPVLNKSLDAVYSRKENGLLDTIELRECNKRQSSPLKCVEQIENMLKDPEMVQDENIYNPDCITIDIKQIECEPGDWIFQNKEKSKMLGCRVPLHVAFHNYLSVRSKLRDAILRYDPVNIDVIHKGLAADGYKYNSKDLFHFMDKKCITIKTTDKTGGARQHQKGK